MSFILVEGIPGSGKSTTAILIHNGLSVSRPFGSGRDNEMNPVLLTVRPINRGVRMKIRIIGSCGSGKSTLARELSKRYDIPYYEIDNMIWDRSSDNRKYPEEVKRSHPSNRRVFEGRLNWKIIDMD